jgi:serine/threonine-protein kinase HipA
VSDSFGLTLNISETDNSLDLNLVRSVAPFFRLTAKAADEIVESSQAVVKQWRKIARRLALSARARDRMASAFRLAG